MREKRLCHKCKKEREFKTIAVDRNSSMIECQYCGYIMICCRCGTEMKECEDEEELDWYCPRCAENIEKIIEEKK